MRDYAGFSQIGSHIIPSIELIMHIIADLMMRVAIKVDKAS